MKRAAIIGSGIGGLGAAIRLAAKGFEVHVFEKNEHPGGKLSQFEVDGFRFDMGPSLFTLPQLVTELFELHGKKASDYLDVVELDMTCNYFFPDGTNLRAWSDRDRFVEEVANAGFDAQVLEDYLERQSFLYRFTSDFFLFNSIHKPSTYVGEAGRRSLKALHRLDAFTTMHARNERTFGKSNLTQLFDRYATYNGSDPHRAPATLNMIAHLEHNMGAFFPKNGMYGIVSALVKLAQEVGIAFHYNSKVTGLKLTKDKVEGIFVESEFHPAELVVNDTDIAYFYQHILPKPNMLRRLMRRERSSSALIFYWGVKGSSNLDVHNILFSSDYRAEFAGLFKQKRLANDLTVYIFISKKVVETDAPEGCENWFVMVNAPEHVGQNWEEETARAREIVLKKMEAHLGYSIEDQIQNEKIVTPAEIESRTASVHGSLYGHSSNSAFAAFLRHPNFSRHYKNLYFVGGSVHPGGGIPLCLASAKIVDNEIS